MRSLWSHSHLSLRGKRVAEAVKVETWVVAVMERASMAEMGAKAVEAPVEVKEVVAVVVKAVVAVELVGVQWVEAMVVTWAVVAGATAVGAMAQAPLAGMVAKVTAGMAEVVGVVVLVATPVVARKEARITPLQ